MQDVTPENFLKVLQGDEEAMKGIGSGKVIKRCGTSFILFLLTLFCHALYIELYCLATGVLL